MTQIIDITKFQDTIDLSSSIEIDITDFAAKGKGSGKGGNWITLPGGKHVKVGGDGGEKITSSEFNGVRSVTIETDTKGYKAHRTTHSLDLSKPKSERESFTFQVRSKPFRYSSLEDINSSEVPSHIHKEAMRLFDKNLAKKVDPTKESIDRSILGHVNPATDLSKKGQARR